MAILSMDDLSGVCKAVSAEAACAPSPPPSAPMAVAAAPDSDGPDEHQQLGVARGERCSRLRIRQTRAARRRGRTTAIVAVVDYRRESCRCLAPGRHSPRIRHDLVRRYVPNPAV